MSRQIGCCSHSSSPSIEVTGFRFDALIVKEVMERVIHYENNYGTFENLELTLRFLSVYSTLKNDTCLINRIVNRLSSESNNEEHNQKALNTNTPKVAQTNKIIITDLDDEHKLIIQKSTKPSYKTS